MRRYRMTGSTGFLLIFTLGMLALLSVTAITLVGSTTLDRNVSANYVLSTWAQLAAESGIAEGVAVLRDMPGGPVDTECAQRFAAPILREWRGTAASSLMTRRGTATIADESAKLNLNDANGILPDGSGERRLQSLVARLGDVKFGAGRGAMIADMLFQDPEVGRAAYTGDRFPEWNAVPRALRKAGLSAEEIEAFCRELTLHSWQDSRVLKPGLPVYGGDGMGVELKDMAGREIGEWLEFQTREFALEPRAPVNLNMASVELIQTLIQAVQGAYVEEGPAENQSSEHYGWWSTGQGEEDPNLRHFGVVRMTRPMSDASARRLARAMHDRIHGAANADLMPDQSDTDGDGAVDANRFETWEEFRHFLEHGLIGSDTLEPGSPAYAIWLETDAGLDAARQLPRAYASTQAWVDPHAVATPPMFGSFDDEWKSQWSAKPVALGWAGGGEAEALAWLRRYVARFQRDAVLANANPNSQLNDWNPDANVHVTVDKAQLTRYSTEFCFEPTGVFRVESEGEVLGEDGRPVARRRLQAAIVLFDVLRQTTQSEFMAGLRAEDAALAGRQFFSDAQSPATQFGYAHEAPHGARLTLQSYPEPVFAAAACDVRVRQTVYDGSLRLATTEKKPMAVGHNVSAIGHFNGANIDPLLLNGAGMLAVSGLPAPGMSPFYHSLGGNRPHAGALLPAGEDGTPGILYPDGAYSEKNRTLAYRMGNFNSTGPGRAVSGCLDFWIKPNFHMGVPARIRKFVSGPSKPGVFAVQQWFTLYYLANPCGNEADGHQTLGLPAAVKIHMRGSMSTPSFTNQGGRYGFSARNYWTPTHSLAFGCAWSSGIATPEEFKTFAACTQATLPVNRDYPLAGRVPARGTLTEAQGQMAGHHWTHVELYCRFGGAGMDNNKGMICWINGTGRYDRTEIFNHYIDPMDTFGYRNHGFSQNMSLEWLRFGELPAGSAPDLAGTGRPYAADSTIDEVEFGSSPESSMARLTERIAAGRYYSQTRLDGDGKPMVAVYTSPEIALPAAQGRADGRFTLRSVAWTLWRPRHGSSNATGKFRDVVKSVSVNPTDAPDPMTRHWAEDDAAISMAEKQSWDPVSIDVREAGGDWHFERTGLSRRFTYAGGSRTEAGDALEFAADERLQYRVYWHLAKDQSLYESPVLDDVTWTFWRRHPRVLEWSAVPE